MGRRSAIALAMSAFVLPIPAYIQMFLFEFEGSVAGVYVGEMLAVAFIWAVGVVAVLLLNSAKVRRDFAVALGLAVYALPIAYFALYTCWLASFDPNGCFGYG